MKRIITSRGKIIWEGCPDCLRTPLTKVSTETPAGSRAVWGGGPRGQEGWRPLRGGLWQGAGGRVVQAGVAEDVGAHVVSVAQLRAAPADDHGELAFVINALRTGRHDDGFFRRS